MKSMDTNKSGAFPTETKTWNEARWGIALVGALALVAIGCGDDEMGTGGSGGSGGTGGTGEVTFTHFAPEVPSTDDTELTIYVNGEASDMTISYGESTGRVRFPADDYQFGLGTPEAELVTLNDLGLDDGAEYMISAYRDDTMTPLLNAFIYNLTTENLDPTSGRIVFSHGADKPMYTPLDFINVEACPPPIFPRVEFGESGQEDLPPGDYVFGLALGIDPMCNAEVVFGTEVAADVNTVLVFVDEEPEEEGLSPQVWEVVDPAMPVPLI